MKLSSRNDPYRELEKYLEQAQDEVGRALEDLLVSEKGPDDVPSNGDAPQTPPTLQNGRHSPEVVIPQRKHSLPDLSKEPSESPFSTSSIPRRKAHLVNGESSSSTNGASASYVPVPPRYNGFIDDQDLSSSSRSRGRSKVSNGQKASQLPEGSVKPGDGETWDSFYGWNSLNLSRPPSGDVNLLTLYTDRLVEAVNSTFDDDFLSGLDEATEETSNGVILESSRNTDSTTDSNNPDDTSVAESIKENGLHSSSNSSMSSVAENLGGHGKHKDSESQENSDLSESESERQIVLRREYGRQMSWPRVGRSSSKESLPEQTYSGSYPGSLKGLNRDDVFEEDEPAEYNPSVYKWQKLFDNEEEPQIENKEDIRKKLSLDKISKEDNTNSEIEKFKKSILLHSSKELDFEVSDRFPMKSYNMGRNGFLLDSFIPEGFSIDESLDLDNSSQPVQCRKFQATMLTDDGFTSVKLEINEADLSTSASSSSLTTGSSSSSGEKETPGQILESSQKTSKGPERLVVRVFEAPVHTTCTFDLTPSYPTEVSLSNVSTSDDDVFEDEVDEKLHFLNSTTLSSSKDNREEDEADSVKSSSTQAGSVASRGLEDLLRGLEPPQDPPSLPQDAVTQTTPQLSRSSSFTYVTDCTDCTGTPISTSRDSLSVAPTSAAEQQSSDDNGEDTPTAGPPSPDGNDAEDNSDSSLALSDCSTGTPVLSPHEVHMPTHRQLSLPSERVATDGYHTPSVQSYASPSLPTLPGSGSDSGSGGGGTTSRPEPRTLPRLVLKPGGDRGSKRTDMVARITWTPPPELNVKSSSAPLLLKKSLTPNVSTPSSPGFAGTKSAGSTPEEEDKLFLTPRSQSVKDVKEVEAVHACEWLRQAGFPQYVQMYEDNCFPVDINTVLKDHPNLDPDELQSLFRRLNTLNKCARMKSDSLLKKARGEDSDEDEGCALSDNWQFHRGSRRWSRISPPLEVPTITKQHVQSNNHTTLTPTSNRQFLRPEEAYSSHDSVFLDEPQSSPDSERRSGLFTSDERIQGDEDSPGHKLRRSGSERIRDAILRRMDSLRSVRRRKKRSPDSDSPAATPELKSSAPQGDMSCDSNPSTPQIRHHAWGNHLHESHAFSDSECSPQTNTPPAQREKKRGGSFKFSKKSHESKQRWLTPESCNQVEQTRTSVYDNVPNSGESEGPQNSDQEDGDKNSASPERRDSGVGSSLTRASTGSPVIQVPWHCFPDKRQASLLDTVSCLRYTNLSASQMLVLRKLALLRLTALMEKFSPPYRAGWGWAVPKFIKRMRTPDYKDKTVFGVPLTVNLQRTGQPLPSSIQSAMTFLRKTALDATGIFRKSGVRSRIQKLRNMHEVNPEGINYDNQQSYDIADMLKQYFRELPEGLLTNKLSETFICIFQHIPEELRLDAVQSAVLLIPDENREVLETLLCFLDEICKHADENQMTATNLAVCFAPSIFHLSTPRSTSASPRRRRTLGVPDQRELNENRAAHECLTTMISDFRKLFQVSPETIQQCRLEKCEPATLEELGTTNQGNWKSYLDNCLHGLLLEVREKSKGWTAVQHPEIDLSFKKLGDGLPLRLWKASAEVEAPPVELLTRLLRERHIWDDTLLKWRIVSKLDKNTEIFQYVCNSLLPHAPRDFCVLRTWRTDLSKGACALIEVSVEHPDASVLLKGIRGMVLASRYLIEPCGAGKSRVTHISRIDSKGRTPEWYNKVYGHLCALLLIRLRDSFSHGTEGPETKV